MKKMQYGLIAFFLLVVLIAPSLARFPRGSAGGQQQAIRSEMSLAYPGYGSEQPFLNVAKTLGNWSYGDNSGSLKPDELDATGGLPIPGGSWTSHSGAKNLIQIPLQAERPGHYVAIWTGAGLVSLGGNGAANTVISCTGSVSGIGCDNSGCSSFVGQISLTTLTVTTAPTGCSLATGVPISGSGVKISTFGTATIITSSGTACGGNTCYTVNQSQTVASTTMRMGGRFEVSSQDVSGPLPDAQYFVAINSSVSGNPVGNLAVFHINDESAFWASATPCGQGQACIVGSLFKTRIQQANPLVLRDLDFSNENASNCTTWSSRPPVSYYSYVANEMRNAASGTETYVAGGQTITIPKIGQYVNATGSGASGGTVSYNSGTDTYSITLGSGAPVDKQTILLNPPSSGTANSKISFNGGTATAILSPLAIPLSSSFGAWIPQADQVTTLVYDATLGGFMNYGGSGGKGVVGLNCVVPPEVFIELNAELGTTPWHELPSLAQDPMTDWVTQHATYLKATYSPPTKPIYSPINEPWNCIGTYPPQYITVKSAAYIAADTNHAWVNGFFCQSGGNLYGEVGKMASTDGQDLSSVYGAGNYELITNVQTGFVGASVANDVLQSAGYVGQSMAAQTGYTKAASYTQTTRLAVTDYWNTSFFDTSDEVSTGYCYYNYSISSGCQAIYGSQAAAMTAYMNSSTAAVSSLATLLAQWNSFGQTCSFGSRPGGCTVNQTTPLMMYEGGYSPVPATVDYAQPASGASNATNAVLSFVNDSGCVAGMTVNLSSLSGGTWPSAAGNYTVVSATANTCTINLNSTGLGAPGAATFTGAQTGGVPTNLTVTSVSGTLAVGMTIAGPGVSAGTHIASQVSGTPGGAGLYTTDQGVFTNGAPMSGGPTVTYVGSQTYINYVRGASYLSPELDTYTTSIYNTVLANGGQSPSQYQIASFGFFNTTPSSGNPWWVLAFDIYGYVPMGNCAPCVLAGSTMTLRGTVSGVFRIGDTLFGPNVTSATTTGGVNTTISSCTRVGSGPCGTNAGDTLGLSQASTVGASVQSTAAVSAGASTIPVSSCTNIQANEVIFDRTTGLQVQGNFSPATVGSCTSTTLTLGNGDTLKSSTPIGSGDTLDVGPIVSGNATPPANFNSTGTTSPVRAWGAICRFNGNGNQCNGWLLKRDVDPGSNDNDPMWLEKAA